MTGAAVQSILTPEEDAALVLVGCCFGSCSGEYQRFVRYLVEVRHQLPWLESRLPPEDDEVDYDLLAVQARAPGDSDAPIFEPAAHLPPGLDLVVAPEVHVPQVEPQLLPGAAGQHVRNDVVEGTSDAA